METDQQPIIMSPYVDGTCIDEYANMDDKYIRIVCRLFSKNGDALVMACGPFKFYAIHTSPEGNDAFMSGIVEGETYEFIGLMQKGRGGYQMSVSHSTKYNKGYDFEQYPNLVKLWHNPKYKDLFFTRPK